MARILSSRRGKNNSARTSEDSLTMARNEDEKGAASSEDSSVAGAASPHISSLPLSMQLMRPFAGCQDCGSSHWPPRDVVTTENDNVLKEYEAIFASFPSTKSAVSPLVVAPMMHSTPTSPNSIIAEYFTACQLYGCQNRINAGVLTTFRFSLPSLRVSGDFHDADMLALCDVFMKHATDGALNYIQRLDFTVASKEGKLHEKRGFRSHGAFALAKILQSSPHIREVRMTRNRVGPYGASAIFMAASKHPSLRILQMRRCRIMGRGGMAFAELCCKSSDCRLEEVDLSSNLIGLQGSIAIEQELSKRSNKVRDIFVNLEGNLVLQEILNGVTHGLGIILAFTGSLLLYQRVKNLSSTHVYSCAVYSTSLLVLYTSSTLYHSFFVLQNTKYIFETLDKCAIYILIAGSYTPFLQVVLKDNRLWSTYLLAFIWLCGVAGIAVEACFPLWKHKSLFSLAMYLGLGWSCMVCLPELISLLPQRAMNLLVLGGVGYTTGVPFYVRNHNLDHSIWHLFVLAGSMFHWFGIYLYIGNYP